MESTIFVLFFMVMTDISVALSPPQNVSIKTLNTVAFTLPKIIFIIDKWNFCDPKLYEKVELKLYTNRFSCLQYHYVLETEPNNIID